ncbi:MAG: 1-deoxy-D-xylulose-5-phosphate reductoisomerase [Bacteroidales bacterium]
MMKKKRIAILGSTGSIGTQTLEVVREQSSSFEIEILTAQNNADLLIRQALEFHPNAIVIGNETHYQKVKEAMQNTDTKVFAGTNSLCEVVEFEGVDIVVTALMGSVGLAPTLRALKYKKTVALANKETLVMAGALVQKTALENNTPVYPIDSEHSAIFQCLMGETGNEIERILLTGSGGPFRGKKKSELAHITPMQALKHPTWTMGAKITIDSASLMNKGLEMIEAKWLFNVEPKQIEVIIQPESIVHSLVEFRDGSVKAQLGLPSMKLPIQFALTYPHRFPNTFPRLNLSRIACLHFEEADTETFQNLALAKEALEQGGNTPCILNAANEIVVDAFLKEKISFLQMSDIIRKCMASLDFKKDPNLSELIESDQNARTFAKQLIALYH